MSEQEKAPEIFKVEDFYPPATPIQLDHIPYWAQAEAQSKFQDWWKEHHAPLVEQSKADVAQLAAMCNEVVRLREEVARWREFAENQKNNWEASAAIVKNQNTRIAELEAEKESWQAREVEYLKTIGQMHKSNKELREKIVELEKALEKKCNTSE